MKHIEKLFGEIRFDARGLIPAIIQDVGNNDLRISARRQDYKVKMNNLMEKSIKGIPNSNAGGHIPAAAAKIPKRFRGKFRKNLLRAAKKMMKH